MTGNQFNVLGTNNPVLDEITRAHTQLSDPAKMALQQAGLAPQAPATSPQMGVPQAAAMGAPAAPAPKMAMPPTHPGYSARVQSLLDDDSALNLPMGAPSRPAPKMAMQPAPTSAPSERLISPNQATSQYLQDSGSGISQIHNPWARVPLQILDAVGSSIAPMIAQGIPGTELHHRSLQHQADAGVTQDEALANNQSKRGLEQAQTQNYESENPLHDAQTNEANARAENLRNPPTQAPSNAFELWTRPLGKVTLRFLKRYAKFIEADSAGDRKGANHA